MFVDNVKIYVKAGNGGNGCVSFHREKYVARGGPDGGDGGNGGNIILKVEKSDNTLLRYKYKRKFIAANGGDGKNDKFHGANAEDLVLLVPPGTVVRDPESNRIIADLSEYDETFTLAKGGRGGWGNRHFATPTRQVPRFAKSGIIGEEREVILELKMIADVGLVGLPNVGKSSILSIISDAKPKIANYHFTTLSPNIGVIKTGEGSGFTAADIPGLIEGASQGLGLGHDFLRHVDRCRLLLHVVDVSCFEGNDPIDDIKLINNELKEYSEELSNRPQIVVANKCDSIDEEKFDKEAFEKFVKDNGWELIYVSAVTGENIDQMVRMTAECLKDLPDIIKYEADYTQPEFSEEDYRQTIIKNVNGVYVVEGDWLYKVMGSVNFDDRESLMYFQRVLRKSGVIDMLREKGCEDGDTVNIYDFEFDFIN